MWGIIRQDIDGLTDSPTLSTLAKSEAMRVAKSRQIYATAVRIVQKLRDYRHGTFSNAEKEEA